MWDKLKHLAKQYATSWREWPGMTALLHLTVTGGVACTALMARDERAGLAAALAWLAVLMMAAPVCAAVDRQKG